MVSIPPSSSSGSKQKYNAEIIAYCADVGQGDELDGLEAKALSTGASKCFIGDLKEDFAANYIFPMIQANAIYEGRYLLGTSIARPCITKGMMDVALAEGADAIAHGATGKGNDQVRFELSAASLAPQRQMHRPVARRRVPQAIPRPLRNDRLRRGQQHPDQGLDEEALLDGPQPPPHLLRGRCHGRPVV